VELTADDQALLLQVIDYYHETLKASPEALAYLEKRGLKSMDMIAHLKLGYANRTLGYRLPARNRVAGSELRGRLIKLGILRESGHEHFNGSLVIPVLDEHGNVTELYGRKIRPDLGAEIPKHLYLPGPHKGVFNIKALADSPEIILCEALIDALTFWGAGYRHVTASYGVQGFTEDHLSAFRRYGIKRVLIAYDRDSAGEQAALALAEKLAAEGMSCYRIQFPKGMDANEYALKVKPPEKSLGLLIESAVPLGPAPLMREGPSPNDVPQPLACEEGPVSDQKRPVIEPVSSDMPIEVRQEEILITLGDRNYKIRGLSHNMSYDLLRVQIRCSIQDLVYIDTVDLFSARQRANFIQQVSQELQLKEEIVKKDVGRLLLKLEVLQDEQIRRQLEPKQKAVVLTEREKEAALDLLQDPKLLDRILSDFERCGVVGESTNKLVGYLAAVSRKLPDPLAVIIQSSSAAGKSALMEAILSFVPAEERVKYSAMTGQALFYMQDTNLAHKILAIVEEQGAERASYALKLLQSEGELTIASTGKDPETGRLVTHEYQVKGPVMIFLTTTAIEVDEELLNRCLVLSVDEEREQTRAIHRLQREQQTLEGLLAQQDREQIIKVHQDAQRLLKPLLVVNPYARALTFLDDRTRTRRDHLKYLTLIKSIALLHQYQRPLKSITRNGQPVTYIEVTIEDIAMANRLAHQVLGRSLDELPPQTRRLLILIDQMVSEACQQKKIDRADDRFTCKQMREYTGWSHTQVWVHLNRLVAYEYVAVHRSGRGNGVVYELLYDGQGQDGKSFLMGLIDVEALRKAEATTTTDSFRGEVGQFSGSIRGTFGPFSGDFRPAVNGAIN
jgi:DNA primase